MLRLASSKPRTRWGQAGLWLALAALPAFCLRAACALPVVWATLAIPSHPVGPWPSLRAVHLHAHGVPALLPTGQGSRAGRGGSRPCRGAGAQSCHGGAGEKPAWLPACLPRWPPPLQLAAWLAACPSGLPWALNSWSAQQTLMRPCHLKVEQFNIHQLLGSTYSSCTTVI